MRSTLLLDVSYEPLTTISARSAIAKVVNERAVSIHDSGRFQPTGMGEMIPVPYVILLTSPAKGLNRTTRVPRFSYENVKRRDDYLCLYCTNPAESIDHVYPQHLGGPSTFDNCVASCHKCNGKKGGLTLEQLGWKNPLPRNPVPSWYLTKFYEAPRGSERQNVWAEHLARWDSSVALRVAA